MFLVFYIRNLLLKLFGYKIPLFEKRKPPRLKIIYNGWRLYDIDQKDIDKHLGPYTRKNFAVEITRRNKNTIYVLTKSNIKYKVFAEHYLDSEYNVFVLDIVHKDI